MTNDLTIYSNLEVSDVEQYERLMDLAGSGVAPTTARVYKQTHRLWLAFCNDTDKRPLDFTPEKFLNFLKSQHVTMETRKRQASAMRKIMALYLLLTDDVQTSKTLQYLKEHAKRLPETNTNTNTRSRHAMTPAQVHRIMTAWDEPPTAHYRLLFLRNRALTRLIFATGMRRAEAAALTWDDINLDAGTVFIAHGKGDKERTVAIVGDMTIKALEEWKDATPGRKYAFMNFSQKHEPDADSPINGHTVWRVIQRTEVMTGLTFTPHTARRTFITEALRDAPVHEVQAQAGHRRGDTTLAYAAASDAEERRKLFKSMRYGD